MIDATSPPNMAGATLSGWPSVSIASFNISSRENGSPSKAFAPSMPVSKAAELEPRPDPSGTRLVQWIFSPLHGLPASS
jgi:hypothetical protein